MNCKHCGHSVIFHIPLIGCMACDRCDQFYVRIRNWLRGGSGDPWT